MKPLVLMTGVNGFIGAHILRRLIAEGYDVLCASVEPSLCVDIPDVRSEILYEQVDIADRDRVEKLFSVYDVSSVIHLAALVHKKSNDLSFATYERINYLGAKNVFECAEAHGVKRMLFASTIEVYGEPPDHTVSEDTPRSPKTYYAITKRMAEDCLFGMQGGMQGTVMRFAPVYAPSFTLNLDKRIYAVRGKWAYYFRDGGYSFHFCSVNNILDFITAWLSNPEIRGVFNIADAEAVKASELVRLAKAANPKIRVLHLPYPPAYAAVWCMDRLLQLFGRRDSMFSVYNFRKLFQSAKWDTRAASSALPGGLKWNVKNTLYPDLLDRK